MLRGDFMKGITRIGRPGSIFNNQQKKATIDIRKLKPDLPKENLGNKYKEETSVYRKDLGSYVTSTGYIYGEKPEGFKFLGDVGSKFRIQGLSSQIGRKKFREAPKPSIYKSFSEYYLGKEFGGNQNAIDVVRNATGIITEIKAKPTQFTSFIKKPRKGKKEIVTSIFTPREVKFTNEGKIISDIKRNVYEQEFERDDDGEYTKSYGVYTAGEKLYDNGIIQKEIERKDYTSYKGKNDGDRKEKKDTYNVFEKIYDKGKLKQEIKKDTYDSYYRNDGKRREEIKGVYVDENILYNPETTQIVTKQKYDTFMDRVKADQNRKYWEPYLRKEWDYNKGIYKEFSPGNTKYYGAKITEEEFKANQSKLLNNPNEWKTIITGTGEKFSSYDPHWLKQKAKFKGGIYYVG